MVNFFFLLSAILNLPSGALLKSNNLGDCLNDEPQVTLYKTAEMLPGAVYDADAQCRLVYPSSKVCRMNADTFCEMLLCQTSPTECMGNEEPPADGTKCGENMWCYRKKCVQIGGRPEAVNGGWSEWSTWSKCSRTCGGGVSVTERQCNNPTPEHKGRYCTGEKRKTKICNLDPCPAGSLSYRDLQCQEHNSQAWNGKSGHQWKAYLVPDEACVLYCLNQENVFAKLEPRVKDGTPCKPGTKDLCISGVCKKIGCDGQIDSDAVEDACGICNGDGSQCKMVDNTYQESGEGYKEIAKIPKGARNVIVEEMDSSMNTLALSDVGKTKYYLNPDFSEQGDGPVTIGGQASAVTGLYSHPEPQKEHLDIHGPLPEDVLLYVVFYRPENVGYHYKWAEAGVGAGVGGGLSGSKAQYHWEQVDWEDCTANCGGGFQKAKFSCIGDKVGKVGNTFCESLDKPAENTRKCNEQPCKTKWKVGNWGKCHACKYKSGVRMREVECVKESPHPGAEDILTEDSECKGPKPGTRELCNSHKKCKSRRFTDGLPDEMMEEIWKQIYDNRRKRFLTEHPTISESGGTNCKDLVPFDVSRYDKPIDKKAPAPASCGNGGNDAGTTEVKSQQQDHPKLNVGATIKDKIPKDEIKLIEVPLKQSHLSVDLSDDAFETMGDKVADSLDTEKAKIATGDAAVKILKSLQHEQPETKDNENKGHKQ